MSAQDLALQRLLIKLQQPELLNVFIRMKDK